MKDTAFEHLVELARLKASYARNNPPCIDYHLHRLKDSGESKDRLKELNCWRESASFTGREKAVFDLSDSVSLQKSEGLSLAMLQDMRRYFDSTEMVDLMLSVIAVNDWIDLHEASPVRILVVEDDLQDQDLLRRQLQKSHMAANVIFVSDADEALKYFDGGEGERFRRDLIAIFLDIHLPGMSGIDFLREIRAMPNMQDFPVIVMTSSQDPYDLVDCKRLKVASYVSKPVTLHSFSCAVANIFHQAVLSEAA